MTVGQRRAVETVPTCGVVPAGVHLCRPVSAAPDDFLMTHDDALLGRCGVETTTVGWVLNQTCGSLPPFEPGPKLNAARCEHRRAPWPSLLARARAALHDVVR
jgi:hypothetical protein